MRARLILVSILGIGWLILCGVVLIKTSNEVRSQRPAVEGQTASQGDISGDKNPTAQAAIGGRSMDANWLVALLTTVIAFASVMTWLVYRDMHQTNKAIERAYVTMSHLPPGAWFGPVVGAATSQPMQHRNIGVAVQIENCGNTPARITAIAIHPFIGDSLPEEPQYDGTTGDAAFLVKSGTFQVQAITTRPPFQIDRILDGEVTLWMIGYVDYIDSFGGRHRSGYARVYDRIRDGLAVSAERENGAFAQHAFDANAFHTGNNLTFVTQRRYNYDRLRLKGEGNDWNES